jgi:integrase/recombinase XerD
MKLTMSAIKPLYDQRLIQTGVKPVTICRERGNLKTFERFLDGEKGKNFDLREFSRADMIRYLEWLRFEVRYRRGGVEKIGYDSITVAMCFRVVKKLFRILREKKLILTNPLKNIPALRVTIKVRVKLDEAEMEQFLDGINIDSLKGHRNKAMFELMYSSALRSGEIGKLQVKDVDLAQRLMVIRKDKVGKDAAIPFTQRAAVYLCPLLQGRDSEDYIFTSGKRPIRASAVNAVFRYWAKKTGVYRNGLSVHGIRASTATILLRKGADLKFVQKLLRHASIESTAVYTHEAVDNLKRIYKTYHPRENGLWKEIDQDYLTRWNWMKSQLESSWEKRLMRRQKSLATNAGVV